MGPVAAAHTEAPPRQVMVAREPHSGSVLSAHLPDRLRAAKPVTWRGRGDLAQVPWTSGLRGTWLVLDLWAGISGLCVALLQCGVHFYGVAAECDEVAATVAMSNMPNLLHVSAVEDLHADQFVSFLQRRKPRGVIMGGGSPCQGNSSLNKGRRGLADPRSLQPAELRRLRAEFEALSEMDGVELVIFLENVASMPLEVRRQYTEWLGGAPVLIDSACCGWVQRRRLYWLASRSRALTSDLQPPLHWDWDPSAVDVPILKYSGDKPVPNRCLFHQGFHPFFDPKEVVKQSGRGAMHPFTREFFHPLDRTASSSAEAVERFMHDSRRFPPSAYEATSLLWKNDEWRQPSPAERAQMMGIPPEALTAVPGAAAVRRQKQNSLLGNGFHVFSVMAIFCLLPQMLEAKLARHVPCDEAFLLAERLQFSIWEPGRLGKMPGLLDSHALVAQLPGLFPTCDFPSPLWPVLQRRLHHCDLASLQAYAGWCRLRGMTIEDLGPQPLHKRDRAIIYNGALGQRHPADSSKGLDHVLPPGLGKRGHVAAAADLPSPFQAQDWPELDVCFVVDAICRWRATLPAYAAKLRHVLQTVSTALAPLEEVLTRWRVASAARVASSKQPGFVALMTLLLRWPDRSQANCLIRGYPIVGEIEPTGVFRSVEPKSVPSLEEWLADASEVVDRLMHSRPPKHVQDILEQTEAEQAKGFCSRFYTRDAMDQMFGVGQWRPLERFQITQADNKKRMIDNARKTAHNSHTAMAETIFTVSVDFVSAVAAMLGRRLPPPASSLGALDWLRLRLGTDDLPDAYRGLPVHPDHQAFSVVAIYVPDRGWRFTLLWGLAFGLESAVVSFNRFPQLGMAIARRCCLALTAAYFDDMLAMETIADHNLSQLGLRLVCKLLGASPQVDKSFSPSCDRHFLGTSIHTGDFGTLGVIRIQPKYTTREKVLARIDTALSSGQLSVTTRANYGVTSHGSSACVSVIWVSLQVLLCQLISMVLTQP